jgi:hypothetical protein
LAKGCVPLGEVAALCGGSIVAHLDHNNKPLQLGAGDNHLAVQHSQFLGEAADLLKVRRQLPVRIVEAHLTKLAEWLEGGMLVQETLHLQWYGGVRRHGRGQAVKSVLGLNANAPGTFRRCVTAPLQPVVR